MLILRRALHTSPTRHFKFNFNTAGSAKEVSYSIAKTLKHPPELFYKVISDVSSYHEFVPYCTRSFINQYDRNNEPTEAGLRVGWRSFEEEFVCNLQCSNNNTVVAESITHSLFNHLYTKWEITPVSGERCQIDLLLKYQFKSEIYNSVSAYFAESVSELVINAFDKRAFQLKKRAVREQRRLERP